MKLTFAPFALVLLVSVCVGSLAMARLGGEDSHLIGSTEDLTVTKNDGKLAIGVENKPGVVLPETGGMGTTVFYIVGGLMVLVAVVLLVTKKRMNTAE